MEFCAFQILRFKKFSFFRNCKNWRIFLTFPIEIFLNFSNLKFLEFSNFTIFRILQFLKFSYHKIKKKSIFLNSKNCRNLMIFQSVKFGKFLEIPEFEISRIV